MRAECRCGPIVCMRRVYTNLKYSLMNAHPTAGRGCSASLTPAYSTWCLCCAWLQPWLIVLYRDIFQSLDANWKKNAIERCLRVSLRVFYNEGLSMLRVPRWPFSKNILYCVQLSRTVRTLFFAPPLPAQLLLIWFCQPPDVPSSVGGGSCTGLWHMQAALVRRAWTQSVWSSVMHGAVFTACGWGGVGGRVTGLFLLNVQPVESYVDVFFFFTFLSLVQSELLLMRICRTICRRRGRGLDVLILKAQFQNGGFISTLPQPDKPACHFWKIIIFHWKKQRDKPRREAFRDINAKRLHTNWLCARIIVWMSSKIC